MTVALILLAAVLAAIALGLWLALRARTADLVDAEQSVERLLCRLRETERIGVVDTCQRTRGSKR